MIRKIDSFRKVFCMVYDVLFFTLIIYFLQGVFFKVHINLIPPFALFFIFTFSDICAEKSTNFFFLCLPQLIIGALIYFMPIDGGSRAALSVVAFYKLVASVMYVKHGMNLKTVDEAPWVTTIISLIIYGFGSYMENEALVRSSYVLLLLLLLIFFIRLYLQGLSSYINSTKDVSGLPLSKIVSVNNVMIGGILIFFLLMVAVSGLFDFKNLITLLLGVVRDIFLLAFAGIRSLIKLISGLMYKTDAGEAEYVPEFTSVAAEDNTSFLAEFIEMIIKFAVLAAVVYLLYSGLRRLVVGVMKKRLETTDVVESADRYEVETIVPETKKKGTVRQGSANERLRKIYKRNVKKYSEEIGLKSSYTCGDIEEKMLEKNLGDISEATRLYQQVRYGEEQADRKTVKDMGKFFHFNKIVR